MNEYPYRVAAAVDEFTKAQITAEADKRRCTESTLVRDILHTYFAFHAASEGNRVTRRSEGDSE